jgi:hypothetical protein
MREPDSRPDGHRVEAAIAFRTGTPPTPLLLRFDTATLGFHYQEIFMAATTASSKDPHAASPKLEQKDNIYEAEYLGSGTFRIVKPKRKDTKRRQSALKGTTRGSRK